MNYKFKIEEIEGEKVLLKDETGESFVWPKFKLPKDIVLGQDIYFCISTKEISEAQPAEILKEILKLE